MSVAGRPHRDSVYPEIYRSGSKSVFLCGLNPSGDENREGSSSWKGKAKAMYPSITEDEFVGDMSIEGLHPELNVLWRSASAAQRNRDGRHKSPSSRFARDSSHSESKAHGSQSVRWPYAAEGPDVPHVNFFVGVDHDQRTHRAPRSFADEDQNMQYENEPQLESSSTVNYDVKEQPSRWEAWKDHRSTENDPDDSDNEILIPRTTGSRTGWRNRGNRGLDIADRMARRSQDQRLARVTRAVGWAKDAAVSEKYIVFGSNLVTCAAGLDIRNIVPGFNLCSLKVNNLPAGATAAEVDDVLFERGLTASDFYVAQVYNVGSTSKAIVLIHKRYGQAIASDPEGIGFRQQVLTFDLSDFIPPNSMVFNGQPPSLSVSWEVTNRPLIATYRSPEEALRRAGELNGMVWKGRRLRVSVIESHPRASTLHSVKITNPPEHVEMDFEFCCFVGTLLVQPSRGTSCDYLETLPIVCGHLQQQRGVLMDTLEVFPVDSDGVATIQVNFDNWVNLRRAYTSVHNSRPGFGNQGPKLRAWSPHTFEYYYSTDIPKRQYLAQKTLWDAIREGRDDAHEGGAGIVVEETDDAVVVSVLGDDQKAIGALKVRMESVIAGAELDMTCWHSNFLLPHEGEPFFERVYDETGVLARTDFKKHSLRIYGEPGVIENARQLIEEEVRRLRNVATTKPLHRETVAFFVREGIGRLKELIGDENVILDLASRPCTITTKGGPEASHHLQRLIEESCSVDEDPLIDINEETLCPVCYTYPSNPEYLECGHSYCAGCLNHLLSSAADSKRFPIVCLGNEATCHSALPIPFLQRFLPHQAFHRLIEAAFTCYIEQHPQEYRYCPTVDCKQVYRRQQHTTSLQCPSCFASICPACADESHGDLTCEESHFQRDPAMQQLVNEQFGFKKCPQCHAWIEKAGGCNHLQCSCGAHICWRCMGVFNAANIYAHMNNSHGGIHAAEIPQGLDVGADPAVDFIAQQANLIAQIEMERGEVAGRDRFDFFGQLQPPRFPPYGVFNLEDEFLVIERRRSPPPRIQERRRLIAEVRALYTRRFQQHP